MRLGVVLDTSKRLSMASLVEQATAAEQAGLDAIVLEQAPEAHAPMVVAAALATRSLAPRILVAVHAGSHPLAIAESAVVADNCSNGRLTLIVGGSAADESLLHETVEVLLPATSGRPFSHVGERWRIPATLPENDGAERRIVVTPPPAQLSLPIWLQGPAAAPVGARFGLPVVSAPGESLEALRDRWLAAGEEAQLPARQLTRVAMRDLPASGDGIFDNEELVSALLEEREAWGLEVVLLRPSGDLGLGARLNAIARFGSFVRPRVIQDRLPPGLEDYWEANLSRLISASAAGS